MCLHLSVRWEELQEYLGVISIALEGEAMRVYHRTLSPCVEVEEERAEDGAMWNSCHQAAWLRH